VIGSNTYRDYPTSSNRLGFDAPNGNLLADSESQRHDDAPLSMPGERSTKSLRLPLASPTLPPAPNNSRSSLNSLSTKPLASSHGWQAQSDPSSTRRKALLDPAFDPRSSSHLALLSPFDASSSSPKSLLGPDPSDNTQVALSRLSGQTGSSSRSSFCLQFGPKGSKIVLPGPDPIGNHQAALSRRSGQIDSSSRTPLSLQHGPKGSNIVLPGPDPNDNHQGAPSRLSGQTGSSSRLSFRLPRDPSTKSHLALQHGLCDPPSGSPKSLLDHHSDPSSSSQRTILDSQSDSHGASRISASLNRAAVPNTLLTASARTGTGRQALIGQTSVHEHVRRSSIPSSLEPVPPNSIADLKRSSNNGVRINEQYQSSVLSQFSPPSAPPEKRIVDPTESARTLGRHQHRHPLSLHLTEETIQSELGTFSSTVVYSTPKASPCAMQSTIRSLLQDILQADSVKTGRKAGQHEPPSSHPVGKSTRPISKVLSVPAFVIYDRFSAPIEALEVSPELIDPGLDLPPAPWPQDCYTWLQSIQQAMLWSPPAVSQSPFRFEISVEAAAHNWSILAAEGMDLRQVLHADEHLPTCPGSNFRPLDLLEPIFTGHPNWNRVSSMLSVGANFPLGQLEETTRQSELSQMLEYGNHKSATKARKEILQTLSTETAKAWHLPLPVEALSSIPNVSVAPFGFVTQLKLQADGSRREEGRITHDQTFCFHDDASVNNRVLVGALNPVQYGQALPRILHRLIATRQKYPRQPIYLPKYDWKSAYKNCHFSLETLVQSGTTTKGITDNFEVALLALRMTFGGMPCPTLFSDLSEMVTDAANHLVRDREWKPSLLHSQFGQHIVVEPVAYPSGPTPFTAARPMTVSSMIPVDGQPHFDVFLDDHIGIVVHSDTETLLRSVHVIPLLLDLLGRPIRSDEPLHRDPLLAISKLLAEGRLTEIQVVLGWEIDTRRLLIRLPADKHKLYSDDTSFLAIHDGRLINAKTLETLYGRLVFVSTVIVSMSHCLGRIQSAKSRALAHPKRSTRLSALERNDLQSCLRYLDMAREGIDINLLVSRVPDLVIPTDACLYQVGGYDLPDGHGWRLPVPVGAPRHQINFLEFVGPVCGIWLALFEARLHPGDCVLAIGDNTTAAGWLRRSSFSDESSSPQTLLLARLIAELCLQSGICCYSQWRMGLCNVVPDLISRDIDNSNDSLTQTILSSPSLSSQVPESFQIQHLPNKLFSAISSLMLLNPNGKELQSLPTIEKTWLGTVGCSSLSELVSSTIRTSSTPTPTNDSKSSSPLLNQSAMVPTQSQRTEILSWSPDLCKPPSMVWLRPLKPPDTSIRAKTSVEKLSSSSIAYLKATAIRTHRPGTNKHSQ
jgi:hypothetical protein